ncbi:transglycosylase domain-containing protein [Conexibacter sp. JD483]|uniref:transglycosylase domain-containing protein n=1 Tax=unclassified Conexibacter TaxID=2627773 RepID=UPI0027178EC1|nr:MULTISPECIES: transglycosylase domain-containing protein [unclassified Conexibacter]MDO8184391.1 transglycosylase domain-containing protein [Conexibacter sp. CPCC 205706]MDO8197697.1 transglycosylase domain-containing protein [Conexibacter sp. CPCC 205762]MDR9368360.1 transglycosylase domain-containing protein [Conexibacter sp. JD483]
MRRVFLVITTLLLLGGIGAGVVAASWVVGVVNDTPDIESIRPKPAGAISTVYAADGTRLGFIAGGDTLRTPVDGTKIPNALKQATVAIEDKRFYKHRGVDYVGVLRAAVKNVTDDAASQGGSTLTMQLVRNLYIPENRFKKDLTRKIREAKLADELEKQHSKEWILVSYLNNVPYTTVGGQEAIGVQSSSRVLFDKDVSQLTLAESALLAGLPQAPSAYAPFERPKKAKQRRSEVLRAMVDSRYITQAEADRANAAPLGVKPNAFYQQRKEPFVFDYVRQQLLKKYGADVLRAGGLRVYTSIDLKKQEAARAAIREILYDPADPPAAIVTIDPANGHILAMASSAEYGDERDGKTVYNYAATAQRQPGSTFKTMVLMAALRKGIDPDSTYYTSRVLEPGWLASDPTYRVETFGHTYSGSETITRATLSSDNTVYAQLDADVGPDAVRQAAYDMGITSRLDAYPAEGLGGLRYGVTVLEMANAYATIANGGIRRTPTILTRVRLRDGQVQDLGRTRSKRTFTPAQAEKAREVLEQNVQSGTGVGASYGCPAAGKTGTTSDIKDAWFVGFTPRLSTAVWMGYKTPVYMVVHGQSVQGGTFPAPIWKAYMSVASDGYCGSDWAAGGTFESEPFFGRYSSTGSNDDEDYSYDGSDGSSDGTTDGTGDTTGTDGTTGDTGTGGVNNNPDGYARPPQGEPEIQTEGGGAGVPGGN